MRALVALMLLASSTARADDGASDDLGVTTPLRLHPQDKPILHLDPIPPLATEGIGAQTDGEARVLDLGPNARLVAEGEWWMASLSPSDFGPAIDEMARGWRTSYTLSYDLGLFKVGATVQYGHVDSRYERGTYRYVGIAAYRTFRLSRSMLAWIALAAGRQEWLGVPPAGEANSTAVTLSVGTTF